MKFYFKGVVWDKDTGKQLCREDEDGEKDGVFNTEDKELIKKLKALGVPTKPVSFKNAPESKLAVPKNKPKVRIPKGVQIQ